MSLLAPANAVAGMMPGGGLLPTPNPLASVRNHCRKCFYPLGLCLLSCYPPPPFSFCCIKINWTTSFPKEAGTHYSVSLCLLRWQLHHSEVSELPTWIRWLPWEYRELTWTRRWELGLVTRVSGSMSTLKLASHAGTVLSRQALSADFLKLMQSMDPK